MCKENFEKPMESFPTGAVFLNPDEILELMALSLGKIKFYDPVDEPDNLFTIVGDAEPVGRDSDDRILPDLLAGNRRFGGLTLAEIADHARKYEYKSNAGSVLV